MAATLRLLLTLACLYNVHCNEEEEEDDLGEEHIFYRSPENYVEILEGKRGTFMVYPNDLIGFALVDYGEWEDDTVELLLSHIEAGDTVVEIGAHIGSMTVPLAKKVGPRGKVLAFEPQSVVFQLLNANVALNELFNVRTYQALVSDEAGYEDNFPLVRPDHLVKHDVVVFGLTGGYNYGAGSFDREGTFYQHGSALQSTEKIEIVRMDDYDLDRVSLVKIDAEGHEYQVLNGMRELIDSNRPLLVIEHNVAYKDKKSGVKEIISEVGYECTLYRHKVAHRERWRGVERGSDEMRSVLENYIEENLLCAHKDSDIDTGHQEHDDF